MAWNAQEDPLGLALKGRARDQQWRSSLKGIQSGQPSFSPMNPEWDAYLQALDEQGVDKVTDESAAPKNYRGGGDPFLSAHANQRSYEQDAAMQALQAANPSDERLRFLRQGTSPAMQSLKRGR